MYIDYRHIYIVYKYVYHYIKQVNKTTKKQISI